MPVELSNLRGSVPATIIFSAREMKHYLRWQRQTNRLHGSQLGRIPTAMEYRDYQTWRNARKREAQSFTDPCRLTVQLSEYMEMSARNNEDRLNSKVWVARQCKHVLHPSLSTQIDAVPADMCPCCVIKTHLTYMEVLTAALRRFEGSWHREWGISVGGDHERSLGAWYAAKLQLVQTEQQLEKQASKEAEWEALHPEDSIEGVMSAETAVQMYWRSVDSKMAGARASTRAVRKSVSFGEETEFKPGRPELYFHRKSPRYEPGKYATLISTRADDLDDSEESDLVIEQIDGCTDYSDSDQGEDSEFEDEEANNDGEGEEEDNFIVFGYD